MGVDEEGRLQFVQKLSTTIALSPSRYAKAVHFQMKSPLQRIRRGAITLALIVMLSTVGFRYFGDYDWIGAVWMVVITISTVGYSERSDLDPAVKLYTVAVILFGMSAAAYTFGGLFQWIMEGELDRAIGRKRMTRDLNKMNGHTIVCGFGRMGQILADELSHLGCPVVAIDQDPTVIQDIARDNFVCWQGDATEEATLLTVGIERAKTLIISLPNDAESVFVTLTARNLNAKLHIIARAEKQSTGKKLRQAGADKVVMPTIVGAKQMVRMVTRPTTADLMELVSESAFRDLELDELEILATSPLAGLTVSETEAHRTHKLLVIAVKKSDDRLIFNPAAEYVFQGGDIVMFLGHIDDISEFRRRFCLR